MKKTKTIKKKEKGKNMDPPDLPSTQQKRPFGPWTCFHSKLSAPKWSLLLGDTTNEVVIVEEEEEEEKEDRYLRYQYLRNVKSLVY